jgi:hypothetical protein
MFIKSIDENFQRVYKKFKKIDKRFDKIDKIFDKIDKRFDKIDKRIGKLETSFTKMETSLNHLIKLQTIFFVTLFASILAGVILLFIKPSTDNVSIQPNSKVSYAEQKVGNGKEDFRPFRQNHPEIEPKTEAESDEKLSDVYGLSSEKIAEATVAEKPINPPKEDEKEEELAVAPEP